MKLVVPCAGRSTRMGRDKATLPINGKPLLLHVIDQWVDIVDGVVAVAGKHNVDAIVGLDLPNKVQVVVQKEQKGLADAILQAEEWVGSRFVVNLGDCIVRGTFQEVDCDLGIGVWHTNNLLELNKSYLVGVRRGKVSYVQEKPGVVGDETFAYNCGMGIYFLNEKVFDYIRRFKGKPDGGDFTEVLQMMIDVGEEITPVWFDGEYINVTTPKDIEEAEKILA